MSSCVTYVADTVSVEKQVLRGRNTVWSMDSLCLELAGGFNSGFRASCGVPIQHPSALWFLPSRLFNFLIPLVVYLYILPSRSLPAQASCNHNGTTPVAIIVGSLVCLVCFLFLFLTAYYLCRRHQPPGFLHFLLDEPLDSVSENIATR